MASGLCGRRPEGAREMTQREWKVFLAGADIAATVVLVLCGIDPRSPLLWLLLGLSGGLGIGVLDFHVTLAHRKEKDHE